MKKDLENWLNNGWLVNHSTSRQEISNLLRIIERDLVDCRLNTSSDWRFSIAYNAALQCCLIPLYCSGYRPSKSGGHHYRAIQSIIHTLGKSYSDIRDYLDNCRAKRNISDYERAGIISESEADELVKTVEWLHRNVEDWVRKHFEEYL